MDKITATMVKKLRECTGLGVMDCKQALIKAHGNVELAVKNIRTFGSIKLVQKKDENVASNGIIVTSIRKENNGNYASILEINCQTDFVAKNEEFQIFANKVLKIAISKKIADINMLKKQFEEECTALTAKFGENINIRRISVLESDDLIGSYQHGLRIGVLVSARGADKILIKNLAMHIAASKPEFIRPEDVSAEIIKEEYQVQSELAKKSGKPKEIVKKIIEGRLKKFVNAISLITQPFIMDLSKNVAQLLEEHNATVTKFVRFELGEETKKIEDYSLGKVYEHLKYIRKFRYSK